MAMSKISAQEIYRLIRQIGRQMHSEKVRIVEDWLEKNGIPFEKTIWEKETKNGDE